MTQPRSFGFETRMLHAGHVPDAETGARAVPIHQSTSFVFHDTRHAAHLFELKQYGNIYSRISNPTTAVFEERIASPNPSGIVEALERAMDAHPEHWRGYIAVGAA